MSSYLKYFLRRYKNICEYWEIVEHISSEVWVTQSKHVTCAVGETTVADGETFTVGIKTWVTNLPQNLVLCSSLEFSKPRFAYIIYYVKSQRLTTCNLRCRLCYTTDTSLLGTIWHRQVVGHNMGWIVQSVHVHWLAICVYHFQWFSIGLWTWSDHNTVATQTGFSLLLHGLGPALQTCF